MYLLVALVFWLLCGVFFKVFILFLHLGGWWLVAEPMIAIATMLAFAAGIAALTALNE